MKLRSFISIMFVLISANGFVDDAVKGHFSQSSQNSAFSVRTNSSNAFLHVPKSRAPSSSIPKEVLTATETAVFEVLQKKPTQLNIKTESSLPLDLLPFHVRNDAYYSIGTAFAIEGGTYVSAAHVFSFKNNSFLKRYFIRDRQGHVFELDRVMGYSSERDFISFTVKNRVFSNYLKPLKAISESNRVYAVGNALGDGIVIREGYFTSTTPESVAGRWHLMRFSAPASPGNSGGPLLDDNGNVVAIVLAKNFNENLNYGLPISEFIAHRNQMVLRDRIVVAPNNTTSHSIRWVEQKYKSGMRYLDFGSTIYSDNFKAQENAWKTFSYDKRLFPVGLNSEDYLANLFVQDGYPTFVHEQYDQWKGYLPKEFTRDQALENGGTVQYQVGQSVTDMYARLPNDKTISSLMNNSAQLGDYILKMRPEYFEVSGVRVKITSLGKSVRERAFIDKMGRRWFSYEWLLPVSSDILLAIILPTPNGFFAHMLCSTERDVDAGYFAMKYESDFYLLNYTGTVRNWINFITPQKTMKNLAPHFLTNRHSVIREFELAIPNWTALSKHSLIDPDQDEFTLTFVPHIQDKIKNSIGAKLVKTRVQNEGGTGVTVGVFERPKRIESALHDQWSALMKQTITNRDHFEFNFGNTKSYRASKRYDHLDKEELDGLEYLVWVKASSTSKRKTGELNTLGDLIAARSETLEPEKKGLFAIGKGLLSPLLESWRKTRDN